MHENIGKMLDNMEKAENLRDKTGTFSTALLPLFISIFINFLLFWNNRDAKRERRKIQKASKRVASENVVEKCEGIVLDFSIFSNFSIFFEFSVF